MANLPADLHLEISSLNPPPLILNKPSTGRSSWDDAEYKYRSESRSQIEQLYWRQSTRGIKTRLNRTDKIGGPPIACWVLSKTGFLSDGLYCHGVVHGFRVCYGVIVQSRTYPRRQHTSAVIGRYAVEPGHTCQIRNGRSTWRRIMTRLYPNYIVN